MILTRAFDPSQMGEYFVATAICYLVLLATTFGTSQHLVRSVAMDGERALTTLAEVLALRVPLALLGLVALNGAALLFAPSIAPIMLPVSIFVLIGDLGNAFGAFLTGHRAFFWRLVIGLFGAAVLIASVPVVVGTGASLPQVLLCFVAAGLVSVLTGYVVVRSRYGAIPLGRVRLPDLRTLALACAPFVGLEILQVIQFKVDVLMIFGLVSSAAAAEYETAYRLLEASRLVARPVAVSTLPFVVYLISRGDWDEAGRKARQATLVAALLGLGPLAVGLFAPSQAMRLIWGPDYADAGDILRVLMISAPVVFIVLIGTVLAISLKRERQLIRVLAVAALFNVAANAVAIPVWGAVAAAWTTLATEIGIGMGVLLILGRSEFATLLPRFLRRAPVPGRGTG